MARLRTVAPRLATPGSRVQAPPTPGESRITGRRLQSRRLRIWSRDPHCTDCRELTSYPSGFELDHDVALVNGGTDTDDNCKVRCLACHEAKTRRDLQRFHGGSRESIR